MTEIRTLPGDPFGWDGATMEIRLTVVNPDKDPTDYRNLPTAISLDRWRAYPPLHTFFPLKYKGRARWNTIEFGCGDCKAAGKEKRAYAGDEVRGHVGWSTDREGHEYFVVEAAVLCPECNAVTFNFCLLPDTLQIVRLEKDLADGKMYMAVYGEPSVLPSRWQRLRRWVRGMFKHENPPTRRPS